MGIAYLEDGDSVKRSDTGIVESRELVFSEEICVLHRRQIVNLKKSSPVNTSAWRSTRIPPSRRIDYRSKDWYIPIPLKMVRPANEFRLHGRRMRDKKPETAH